MQWNIKKSDVLIDHCCVWQPFLTGDLILNFELSDIANLIISFKLITKSM